MAVSSYIKKIRVVATYVENGAEKEFDVMAYEIDPNDSSSNIRTEWSRKYEREPSRSFDQTDEFYGTGSIVKIETTHARKLL